MERTIHPKPKKVVRAKEKFEVNSDLLINIFQYALTGKTQKETAELVSMNVGTLRRYMEQYPEVRSAYMDGKDKADAKVVMSLFDLCFGHYIIDEVVNFYQGTSHVTKVKKYVGPNFYAIRMWLSNRQKLLWSESKATEGFNATQININNNYLQSLSMEELQQTALKGLNKQKKDNIDEAEEVNE